MPGEDSLVIVVATKRWASGIKGADWRGCVDSWNKTSRTFRQILPVFNMQVMDAYEYGRIRSDAQAPGSEIIGFLHDDLIIFENDWDSRVLREFEDEKVGMVGFTGALGHGTPDLYTTPYYLPNLARQSFLSNLREAEKHGARFNGVTDVAVCDGMAVFVRKKILSMWGGFPLGKPIGYYMWCENLCCEVRRQAYRIRLVGVDCHHLGGRTSTLHQVKDDYDAEHWYFYEHNRDVMPYRVP